MAKNEVAVAKNNVPVAPVDVDFEADKNVGFENMGSDDFSVPFCMVMQSGSPQVKRSEGEYLEGAQEGMILNSVTKEFYRDGTTDQVTVVPCYYRRIFVERESGEQGKFIREVAVEIATTMVMHENEDKDQVNEANHIMNDTRQFYCLAIDARGIPSPVLISMGSTQIRKAKLWSSLADNIKMRGKDGKLYTPPLFSHSYKLSTVPEQNSKGSWYGWKIELNGPVTDPELYTAAKAFQTSIRSGAAKPASYDAAKEPVDKEKF